jgi:hypothetical protein
MFRQRIVKSRQNVQIVSQQIYIFFITLIYHIFYNEALVSTIYISKTLN